MHWARDSQSERVAFTLVELMIVVVMVAIFALVAVANYQSNVKASKMTEGVTGAGMIRTAMRVYSAAHDGQYPTLNNVDGSALEIISVRAEDLTGKYFGPSDYRVTSSASGYTIRVTMPGDPDCWYEVDEEGNVSENY